MQIIIADRGDGISGGITASGWANDEDSDSDMRDNDNKPEMSGGEDMIEDMEEKSCWSWRGSFHYKFVIDDCCIPMPM